MVRGCGQTRAIGIKIWECISELFRSRFNTGGIQGRTKGEGERVVIFAAWDDLVVTLVLTRISNTNCSSRGTGYGTTCDMSMRKAHTIQAMTEWGP